VSYGGGVEEATRSALVRLAMALHDAGVPFQLGGSGLLHVLGLVDRVGDLDLVFPSEARPALGEVLTRLTRSIPEFDAVQEPGFVSDWRCRHDLDGQALDLSGGVAMVVDGRVVRLPFRPGALWDLGGVPIPLAPPEQWLLVYRVHGSNRAVLLAALVDPVAWQRQVRALGLPHDWG
jgi:hypothetical protein